MIGWLKSVQLFTQMKDVIEDECFWGYCQNTVINLTLGTKYFENLSGVTFSIYDDQYDSAVCQDFWSFSYDFTKRDLC